MEFFQSLDQGLFKLINQNWTAGWANSFFPWLTDLNHELWFQWLLLPLVLSLFVWRFKKFGILVFLICILAVGWADFFGNQIKHIAERPRPFTVAELNPIQRSQAGGSSFVSNHATNLFAFAAFTTMMIPCAFIPTFLLAFLVAYSRVYNGVHYPADVIVGALLGMAWGYLFAILARKLLQKAKA